MSVSLKRSAYEHIRQGLLYGKLPPGTVLSPMALAKELGISHTPVREALSQLESEGLVEQVPRLGARVKVIDRHELEELFEVRELLECGAAALAAERISDEQLANLRQLSEQFGALVKRYRNALKQGTDVEELVEQMVLVDVAFHLQLLGAANNRRMRKIVGDLHLMANVFRYRRPGPTATADFLKHLTLGHQEHGKIVQALQRHDPEAAAEQVRRHLQGARRHQHKMLDALPRPEAGGTTEGAWPEHVLRLIGSMEAEGKWANRGRGSEERKR